jgi:hypothetical protein
MAEKYSANTMWIRKSAIARCCDGFPVLLGEETVNDKIYRIWMVAESDEDTCRPDTGPQESTA